MANVARDNFRGRTTAARLGECTLGKPYFPTLQIGGQSVDFLHLEPFTLLLRSEHAKKTLRVRVTFSTHCFSEEFGKVPHPGGDPVIDEDTKRPRTFCPIRYGLSHGLPVLLKGLEGKDVFQTQSMRNWVYTVTIESPAGPYHVFFEVRKASADQRTWQDLNLVVESAYPQTGAGPAVRGKKPFVLVCGEAYTGNRRPTRKKRRR